MHDHRACRHAHRSDFTMPGADVHYPPDLELEPVHLEIDYRFDLAAQTVDGTVTHTIRARRAGPTRLKLHAVGFLDVAGDWDPGLAFVMAGAIAVYAPLSLVARRRLEPVLGGRFAAPTRSDIDGRLLGGSALFGLGWGMAGFCPGPAIAASAAGGADALVLLVAMGAGMFAHHVLHAPGASAAAVSQPGAA